MDDRIIQLSDHERLRVKELMAMKTQRRFIVVHETLTWRITTAGRTEYASESEAVGVMKDEAERVRR